MRNKYAALALGMVLTMTATPVMAESTTNTSTAEVSKEASGTSSNTESSSDASAPPEKLDGEKPDGEAPGEPPQDENAPDGQGGPGGVPGDTSGGGPGGQSQGVDSYDAVNDCTEDTTFDGEDIESSGTDENAILVEGGSDVTIKDSGNAYVSGSTISTDAKGGAGLFAYGDGTVYAADSTITTQQDTSGGIHAAGGGTMYAWDLDVTTNGESSAAIRSDRGGGTMVVDGGTYTSNGVGSPAVYCTADIAIHDADLTANGSEAVCIEGLNSLHLFDCNLSGNMSDDDQNDCTWGVIVYQSMSGDSEVGNSTFQMTGGTLSTGNGGLLYTTNTECTITLDGVDITYAPDSEFFLRCTGNDNARGWGTAGANGSDCLFTAINQDMDGDVIWDSISNLDFYMTDNSTLTGAFVNDETYAGEGGDGYCNVTIDMGSTWIVTGDSTLSSLSSEGTIVDEEGNTVTIQGSDGTVYEDGESPYTITVDSYETTADTSSATTSADWSDYEADRPESL